ncbi:MAG: ribonuclease H family protein [Gemmatimonadaceae bacterium]
MSESVPAGIGGPRLAGDPPLVAVFADESCLGNGREGENPGGAGVLVEILQRDKLVRRDLWTSEPATTNNRMALRSVIECFHALGRKGKALRVVFTTDSRYIVDGMTSWVHQWAQQGWKRRRGGVENLELWYEAVRVAGSQLVQWRWVRGHAGHPQNEYANYLAMRAADTQTSSGGLVDSGFDEWLERRANVGASVVPEPFPASDAFRAAGRLPTP